MDPVRRNPIHRTVTNCLSKCAYDCEQLQYTIQHRTVLIIFPLTSMQTTIIAQMLSIGVKGCVNGGNRSSVIRLTRSTNSKEVSTGRLATNRKNQILSIVKK